MPLTVRCTIEPGQPQEITFERTYANPTPAEGLTVFKGVVRAIESETDPDSLTNQQLVDKVWAWALHRIWDVGKDHDDKHRLAIQGGGVPELDP